MERKVHFVLKMLILFILGINFFGGGEIAMNFCFNGFLSDDDKYSINLVCHKDVGVNIRIEYYRFVTCEVVKRKERERGGIVCDNVDERW